MSDQSFEKELWMIGLERLNAEVEQEKHTTTGAPAAAAVHVETKSAESALTAAGSATPLDAAKMSEPYAMSDAGFAERLAHYVKGKAFYHTGRGLWYVWDGKCWIVNTVELNAYAIETARAIRYEAAACPKSEVLTKLFKFALKCEELGEIRAAIELAACVPGMAKAAEDLDKDPFLLCCENGTINLNTGELLPHRPGDYITRRSKVCYNPGATDPLFNQYIENVTNGDHEFEGYLRRAAGYSLTGSISEKCLFFLYDAATDTGKSCFVEALITAAGQCATAVEFDLFAKETSGHSKPKYDLAQLEGRRIVGCSEIERGQKLSAAVVKRITGGDTIRVRDCGEKSFECRPVYKLWWAANDAPKCDEDDPATWNRIRRVPFMHQVPKAKRNPAIINGLKDPGSSLSQAFLAWAVRGAMEWQQSGLGSCQAVERSTAMYKTESDPLKDFFEECCKFEPGAFTSNQNIREAYEKWAIAEGIDKRFFISPKALTQRIVAKGGIVAKRHEGRGVEGVYVWVK